MEQFLDVFQKFVFNILLAILPALSVYIIAWIKAQIDIKVAQIEASKPQFASALRLAVSLAVQAAEQAGLAGLIEEKKDYAVTIAQKWLDNEGWDEFDISILEAAIEAEVNKLYPKEEAERIDNLSAW